jgi:hypothetical protein
VLVDVADGTTTADDDALEVAVAETAVEDVGAELAETEDEVDSGDAAVVIIAIVALSEAGTVAEAEVAAEYALTILAIAVSGPER